MPSPDPDAPVPYWPAYLPAAADPVPYWPVPEPEDEPVPEAG